MKFTHRVVLTSAILGLALAASAGTEQASAAFRCSRYVSPVCGVRADGLRATYTNACYARRGGANVLHGGACEGPICRWDWQPVCARNVFGVVRNFSNTCWAEIENAVVLHPGLCQ
jgi:hypothetical protein